MKRWGLLIVALSFLIAVVADATNYTRTPPPASVTNDSQRAPGFAASFGSAITVNDETAAAPVNLWANGFWTASRATFRDHAQAREYEIMIVGGASTDVNCYIGTDNAGPPPSAPTLAEVQSDGFYLNGLYSSVRFKHPNVAGTTTTGVETTHVPLWCVSDHATLDSIVKLTFYY